MAYIVAYQKLITQVTTKELRLPYVDSSSQGQELATIDGTTYVVLYDGAVLPEQPEGISPEVVTLTDALKTAISDASPHVALIRTRVVEKIRAQYSVDDEIKLLRISPSAETTAWAAFVEECRTWGRAEKAKLGL